MFLFYFLYCCFSSSNSIQIGQSIVCGAPGPGCPPISFTEFNRNSCIILRNNTKYVCTYIDHVQLYIPAIYRSCRCLWLSSASIVRPHRLYLRARITYVSDDDGWWPAFVPRFVCANVVHVQSNVFGKLPFDKQHSHHRRWPRIPLQINVYVTHTNTVANRLLLQVDTTFFLHSQFIHRFLLAFLENLRFSPTLCEASILSH